MASHVVTFEIIVVFVMIEQQRVALVLDVALDVLRQALVRETATIEELLTDVVFDGTTARHFVATIVTLADRVAQIRFRYAQLRGFAHELIGSAEAWKTCNVKGSKDQSSSRDNGTYGT